MLVSLRLKGTYPKIKGRVMSFSKEGWERKAKKYIKYCKQI